MHWLASKRPEAAPALTRENDWTSSARRNRSCISHPGKDCLLLHQPGTLPGWTGEGGFERAVQRFDLLRHVDVEEIPAPQGHEPRRGQPPRADKGAQLALRIVCHGGYTV